VGGVAAGGALVGIRGAWAWPYPAGTQARLSKIDRRTPEWRRCTGPRNRLQVCEREMWACRPSPGIKET